MKKCELPILVAMSFEFWAICHVGPMSFWSKTSTNVNYSTPTQTNLHSF